MSIFNVNNLLSQIFRNYSPDRIITSKDIKDRVLVDLENLTKFQIPLSTPTGVIAGTYGNATQVGSFTVNNRGAITSASNINIALSPGTISLTTNHILVGNGLNVAQDVAMSGDATIVSSGVLTLANTGVIAGTYGSSTLIPSITIDSKGRITAASSIAITGLVPTSRNITINGLTQDLTTDRTWTITTTGTLNRISVIGGNGLTPTIDIDSNYIGQATITTLGTITTGTWNGSTIGVGFGGTGSNLSATGGSGQYLKQSSIGASITVGTISASDIPDLTQYFLLAGRSGGQIGNGGIAASEKLEFHSTSHATKGIISLGGIFGINYNEAIDRTGIGTDTPFSFVHIVKDQNSLTTTSIYNSFLGNSSAASLVIGSDSSSCEIITYSSIYSTASFQLKTRINAYSLILNSTIDTIFSNAGIEYARFIPTGHLGIRISSPSAYLHLGAGTSSANTSPLKLTAGTNLTTAETGAFEYNGTNLFFTPTGTNRSIVAMTIGTSYSVGDLLYASTTTSLSKLTIGSSGQVLSVSGGIPTWVSSTSLTTFPSYCFFAYQMLTVNNANWVVNNTANASADTLNAALVIRRFDDTTQEGTGAIFLVPLGATNITFMMRSRAIKAPGVARQVIPKIYFREVSDNAAVTAWSAGLVMTAIDIPTNTNFQLDSQTISLATLGATAGRTMQIEFTRDAANGSDTLVGDWALLHLCINFS